MSSSQAPFFASLILLIAVVASAKPVPTLRTVLGGRPGEPPAAIDREISTLTRTILGAPISNGPFTYYRAAWLIGVSQYEGLVPYLDNSIGPLTGPNPFRFPLAYRTTPNKKRSIMHAIFTAALLTFDLPELNIKMAEILTRAGFDPNDKTTGNTFAGVGNRAGRAAATYVINDATNQLGKLQLGPDREVNFVPFADYTGYVPVNTAFEFKRKSHWQPLGDPNFVQQYAGAQSCSVKPLSLSNATDAVVAPPGKWMKYKTHDYVKAAKVILAYSRKLDGNDTAKMLAELADSGLPNLFNVWWGATVKYNWNFDDQIKYGLGFYTAAYDAATVVLCWKRIYDTARPASVIMSSGIFDRVKAYVSGKGVVEMPANNWIPYLGYTPPEPEYPSGAAAIWSAVAKVGSLFSGSDALGINIVFPQGVSIVEPVVTPVADLTFKFATWDQVAQVPVEGRVYGGVHYFQATKAGYEAGKFVGKAAFKWVDGLVKGRVA